MSAPLVVNTTDGTCWTRREAEREGLPLYALEGTNPPEFVMATYAELEKHGIAGVAFVLPMPVGPRPFVSREERYESPLHHTYLVSHDMPETGGVL